VVLWRSNLVKGAPSGVSWLKMYSELSGRKLARMDRKRRLGKPGLDTSQYVRGEDAAQVFQKRIDRGYTSIGSSLFRNEVLPAPQVSHNMAATIQTDHRTGAEPRTVLRHKDLSNANREPRRHARDTITHT
jgi:hypothetical protein